LKGFLERLEQERMNEKVNTLEGHLVKVVTELYEKGKLIPFTDIWDKLVVDLQGKLDDKRPNKMDTPEFGDVTKQKVGYRLREVLAGEKQLIREGKAVFKAYKFDDNKMRRIAKKYGFNIVTKLPSEPTFEGISTPETMERSIEDNVKKDVDNPQQLGYIGYMVTNVSLDDLVSVYWANGLWDKKVCGVCGYEKESSWEAETDKGQRVPLCDDCQHEFEKRRKVA